MYDKEVAFVKKNVSVNLVTNSLKLTKLLHAADTFPNGGIYEGAYLREALHRYEHRWLPLLLRTPRHERGKLVPPLDVAYAWLAHRLDPLSYERDMRSLMAPLHHSPRQHGEVDQAAAHDHGLHPEGDQAYAFTDGSCAAGKSTAARWQALHGPDSAFYPPRPVHLLSLLTQEPGPPIQCSFSTDVAGTMRRLPRLLHSLLRSHFLQASFLEVAQQRYFKFLILASSLADEAVLIPAVDIELMWWTHLAASREYLLDTARVSGGEPIGHSASDVNLGHCSGVFDKGPDGTVVQQPRSSPQARMMMKDLQMTRAVFEEMFGEPYDPPGTQAVLPSIPTPVQEQLGPAVVAQFYRPTVQPFPYDTNQEYLTISKALVAALTEYNKVQRWRAGGHALYLLYLLWRGVLKAKSSGLRALLGKNHMHKSAVQYMAHKAAGFPTFQNLPHNLDHPYWDLFTLTSASHAAHYTPPASPVRPSPSVSESGWDRSSAGSTKSKAGSNPASPAGTDGGAAAAAAAAMGAGGYNHIGDFWYLPALQPGLHSSHESTAHGAADGAEQQLGDRAGPARSGSSFLAVDLGGGGAGDRAGEGSELVPQRSHSFTFSSLSLTHKNKDGKGACGSGGGDAHGMADHAESMKKFGKASAAVMELLVSKGWVALAEEACMEVQASLRTCWGTASDVSRGNWVNSVRRLAAERGIKANGLQSTTGLWASVGL